MQDGATMVTYNCIQDMVAKIGWLLENSNERRSIAKSGAKMLQTIYSKERQWENFVALL
jgi:spore maturation protein CgeB